MRSHRPRDSQRSRVYAAQQAAGHWDGSDRFASFGEARRYVERIFASAYVREHYPHASAPMEIVYNGHRAGAVAVGSWRIEFGKHGLTKRTALHEAAHVIAGARARHGRDWARVFLDLMRHFMGPEAAAKLREQFVERNVKHRAKRTISPEQREVLRERGRKLAALRAEQRQTLQRERDRLLEAVANRRTQE